MKRVKSQTKSTLESVMHMHTEERIPSKSRIERDGFQGSLFADLKRPQHVTMGDFYELMSLALYGGKRYNRTYVPGSNGIGKELGLVKPDIILTDSAGKVVEARETKARRLDGEVNLIDNQVQRYVALGEHFPNLSKIFEVYSHSVESIKSFDGTEEDLFRRLANETSFLVRLPFKIAYHLWDTANDELMPGYNKEYVRKYGEVNDSQRLEDLEKKKSKVYPTCTCVKNKFFMDLMKEPEGTIGKLKMYPEEKYTVKRQISPKDLMIGSFRVNQFPILDLTQ